MSVMNMHAPLAVDQASEAPSGDADPQDRHSTPARPTVSEILQEVMPLILFVPVAGPPAVLLMAPLLLLVLLLIGPAAVLITLIAAVLPGAGLLVALGTFVASPYLLTRHWFRSEGGLGRPRDRAQATGNL